MRVPILALIWLLALVAACSGDKDEPSAATVLPELAATAGATAIPPPLPTPITEVPGTVWLIDVAAGSVVTLFEDNQQNAPTALFDDENASVLYQTPEGTVRRDYRGTQLELYEQQGPEGILLGTNPWRSTDQGCEYKGQLYEGVPCGSVSPNERWMTYRVNRELVELGASSDLWAVNLETGETRELVRGIITCTQCDGGPPYLWSPSGRYLATGDASVVNRLFLIDLESGAVRDITSDSHVRRAQFSPVNDRLIRPSEDGGTILEDIAAGTRTDLPELRWPAYFDPSGRFIYSVPENVMISPPFKQETAIADASSGAIIARLEGVGGTTLFLGETSWHPIPPHPVIGTDEGFVAALAGVPDCDGAAVYENTALVTCVAAAGAPVFSPDGSQVILARRTGETGPVETPIMQSIGLDIFDIIVVDLATGVERLLAGGALSSHALPDVVWNTAGTHVLVRWPNHYGP